MDHSDTESGLRQPFFQVLCNAHGVGGRGIQISVTKVYGPVLLALQGCGSVQNPEKSDT